MTSDEEGAILTTTYKGSPLREKENVMSKAVSTKTINVINALIFLIAGILFCISTALGEKWIGIVIGVGVLLMGLITVVGDFLKEKSLLTRAVLVGGILTALGIYLIVDSGLVAKILGLIPYILIVLGACVFVDAFLLKYVRNDRNVLAFVVELFIGLALIVFGILMLTVASFKQHLGVIFGILLILYACYLLVATFSQRRSTERKSSKK